jgi:GNAT superfamily N-acetyltransferase
VSYDIQHITKDEILHGFAEGYYCCMSNILGRKVRCDMWSTIYDRVGSIGVLARTEDWIIGQLILMPKDCARRIGMPRGQHAKDVESTMVISCVMVQPQHKHQGIATSMVAEVVRFCKERKFKRIEAYVDPLPPQEAAEWVPSFSAFKKFGFAIEGPKTAWESKPGSRICYLDL